MGTTAKGFRYPAPTDRVADGATAIQNLATDVDNYLSTHIKSGRLTITFAAGVASGTVTFATPFPSAAPRVQLTAWAITGNTSVSVNLTGVTASGFNYRAQQQATGTTYAGTVNLDWTATDL